MFIETTPLAGLLVFRPRRFSDDRGYFSETWQINRYREAGIHESFVQDNMSRSKKGVLRGLHFQNPNAQGKLVSVLSGTVFDVAVDVRKDSPTFGKWFGLDLSEENGLQFWIPGGFAHGFYVTSDEAIFVYKCTGFYDPVSELSLRWDDPDIAITWPIGEKKLAKKDAEARPLVDLSIDRLRF